METHKVQIAEWGGGRCGGRDANAANPISGTHEPTKWEPIALPGTATRTVVTFVQARTIVWKVTAKAKMGLPRAPVYLFAASNLGSATPIQPFAGPGGKVMQADAPAVAREPLLFTLSGAGSPAFGPPGPTASGHITNLAG